jgi:hypothetical protein
MADDETKSGSSDSSSDSDDDGAVEDMGVRLVARSADGTKLVNSLDVFPRFELSI